ncbi:O-antigen ligase [Bradyrhizobium sp.]|uniref:O-antigen ligase family protein n=1 Tax=Bradyrhizobium sp. TaxID=376 RepID=UPI002636BCB0|nr:O-antigen ligase family protein [Bradyrhizobium sp.]
MAPPRWAPPRWALRAAQGAVALLPLFLLHARALAEVAVATADLVFLWQMAATRSWRWLRAPEVLPGLLFWAWQLICSLPGHAAGGMPAFIQALASIRWFLLIPALSRVVLAEEAVQTWFMRMLTVAVLYIGGNVWLQQFTGFDLWEFRRWADGSLTGPFYEPRASAPLVRMLFPVLLPWVARARLAGATVLLLLTVVTMVLIGQRMPVLLLLLGLATTALLLPRLRKLALGFLVLVPLLVLGTVLFSPQAHHRLVTLFANTMLHFPDSPYGSLYLRALAMAQNHPWLGWGFDGFRHACADPQNFRAFPELGQHLVAGGGAGICNIHPHNIYFEALTNAGLPGLVFFAAAVLAWMLVTGRGLWRGATTPEQTLRAGVLVAILVHFWPIASSSSAFDVYTSGIGYMMAGFGVALARAAPAARGA